MLIVTGAGRFKKDLALMRKRGKKLAKLEALIERLEYEEPIPHSARPHRLTGNWEGHWELHVEPDWLLIYTLTPERLYLVRTGTHADLFA